MAKFCTKCGAQMDDDAMFCTACGTPVNAPQPEPQPQQAPQQEQYQQQAQQQYQPQPEQQYQQAQGQQQYQQYQQQGQQQYQQYQQQGPQGPNGFEKATGMHDYTSQFHPQDIANNKGYSVLSYLGLLTLIPFLSQRGKSSPYTHFHAVQGMYLMICEIAISIISSLLGLIRIRQTYFGVTLYSYVPWPIQLIRWVLSLICLAFQITGIVFAATGKAKDLPFLANLRKLNWFK